MFNEFFLKENKNIDGRDALTVKIPGAYSLDDTFLCGQCFRYEEIKRENGYVEYFTVTGDTLVFVGQKEKGELIFYGIDEETFDKVVRPYFDLDTDYRKIKGEILKNFSTEFLSLAADSAEGIAILRQEPWETICSFIISQNNNIPRIRKIVREISSAYGVNLALQKGIKTCPISKNAEKLCEEKCKACGRCYTFPSAEKILKNPSTSHLASDVDSAYITTFDSYALSIVKKYHYLLGVDKNISVIDNSIIELFKINTLNSIFESLYEEKDALFLEFINKLFFI